MADSSKGINKTVRVKASQLKKFMGYSEGADGGEGGEGGGGREGGGSSSSAGKKKMSASATVSYRSKGSRTFVVDKFQPTTSKEAAAADDRETSDDEHPTVSDTMDEPTEDSAAGVGEESGSAKPKAKKKQDVFEKDVILEKELEFFREYLKTSNAEPDAATVMAPSSSAKLTLTVKDSKGEKQSRVFESLKIASDTKVFLLRSIITGRPLMFADKNVTYHLVSVVGGGDKLGLVPSRSVKMIAYRPSSYAMGTSPYGNFRAKSQPSSDVQSRLDSGRSGEVASDDEGARLRSGNAIGMDWGPLASGRALDENMVDAILASSRKSSSDVHVFGSGLYTALFKSGFTSSRSVDLVNPSQLVQKSLFLLPVSQNGKMWTLAIANARTKTMEFYNPFGLENLRVLLNFADFLEAVGSKARTSTFQQPCWRFLTQQDNRPSKPKLPACNTPLDSGLVVCLYAAHLMGAFPVAAFDDALPTRDAGIMVLWRRLLKDCMTRGEKDRDLETQFFQKILLSVPKKKKKSPLKAARSTGKGDQSDSDSDESE